MDLTVGELSLVDLPANEAEFVVTKNQKENSMKNKQSTEGSDTTTAEIASVETNDDDSNPAVLKAMEHISNIVKAVAQAGAPAATETEEESDPAEAVSKGKKSKKADDEDMDDEEKTKKAKKTYSMRESMKKLFSGADEETFEKAMGLLKAAGLDPNAKFQDKQPPVTKSADASVTTEDIMEVIAASVTKAKSFTPDRVEKLRSAMEVLKLLLDDVGMNNVPSTSTPGLKTSPGSALQDVKTTKSADTDVAKALGEVAEVLKALVPRLDNVEKEVTAIKSARPAPEGETNSGTETKTKKNGSLWGGVL